MAKVVSMERVRTARLADTILRELRMSGARELRVPKDQVENPARWRRAAVVAAHRLGFPASTLVWGNTLVLSVHKPATAAESRLAAEATTALLLGSGWQRH